MLKHRTVIINESAPVINNVFYTVTGSTEMYYSFDTNGNDGSTNGNNLTETITTGEITYSTSYGRINKGVYSSTGSTLTKSSPTGLPTGSVSITIMCWIYSKETQSGNPPGFVCWGNDSNNGLCGLGITPNSLTYLGYNNDVTSDTWSYNNNEWYFVAMTISSKTVKFYVNGSKHGADKTLSNTPNVGSNGLIIGSQRPGSPGAKFIGYLDEIIVENVVKTESEILAQYNKKF
jgi:hypothetical protein